MLAKLEGIAIIPSCWVDLPAMQAYFSATNQIVLSQDGLILLGAVLASPNGWKPQEEYAPNQCCLVLLGRLGNKPLSFHAVGHGLSVICVALFIKIS
jgi:hypothetical protein